MKVKEFKEMFDKDFDDFEIEFIYDKGHLWDKLIDTCYITDKPAKVFSINFKSFDRDKDKEW